MRLVRHEILCRKASRAEGIVGFSFGDSSHLMSPEEIVVRIDLYNKIERLIDHVLTENQAHALRERFRSGKVTSQSQTALAKLRRAVRARLKGTFTDRELKPLEEAIEKDGKRIMERDMKDAEANRNRRDKRLRDSYSWLEAAADALEVDQTYIIAKRIRAIPTSTITCSGSPMQQMLRTIYHNCPYEKIRNAAETRLKETLVFR